MRRRAGFSIVHVTIVGIARRPGTVPSGNPDPAAQTCARYPREMARSRVGLPAKSLLAGRFEEVAMEYKVLTKEDRRWSGKFSPENLEHTLNSYAAEGWRVVGNVPVASMWTLSTSQIMILLEREAPAN